MPSKQELTMEYNKCPPMSSFSWTHFLSSNKSLVSKMFVALTYNLFSPLLLFLIDQFSSITIKHIPRDFNIEVDALVQAILYIFLPMIQLQHHEIPQFDITSNLLQHVKLACQVSLGMTSQSTHFKLPFFCIGQSIGFIIECQIGFASIFALYFPFFFQPMLTTCYDLVACRCDLLTHFLYDFMLLCYQLVCMTPSPYLIFTQLVHL